MTGKFLFTIVGILIAIFALCNLDFTSPVIEGWNGMDGLRSVTVRKTLQNPQTGALISAGHDTVIDTVACGGPVGGGTDRATMPSSSTEKYRRGQNREGYSNDVINNSFYYAGPSPYENPYGQPMKMAPVGGKMIPQQLPSGKVDPLMGSGSFFSTPSFQSNLSPRFDNNAYGAFINYNAPDHNNRASPFNPLGDDTPTKENYIRENYGDNGSQITNPPSCGKGGYGFANNLAGGYEIPAGYANGNKNQLYDSLPGVVVSNACGGPPGASSSDVPTGSITLTDDAGHPVQYLTQDRYMFTTKKSRLWGLGDMIRGDIPVTPNFYGNFDTYPVIASDVNRGALAAMAGNRALDPDMVKLIGQVTGGEDPPIGGSPIMTNQVDSGLSADCSSIALTAFP
jgi:hypothetical protein